MVLTVTEPARDKILELRAQEEAPDTLGLRIEVTGVQGVEYTYDLTFDPVADADVAAGDLIETQGELPVIIPVDSLDALKGATLDLPSSASNGLVLRNPNRPDPLSGAHIELSGTTDEKVRQLLDGQINPALAMHGGFAALDRVEGDVVYVTMGGGCQGCAVSAMTLREGIARSIKEAIPEVTEVVDTTDHAMGENPYYT
ncbi:MAG TPA: NifU family protein [Acidimicrobiales bacterium]|jgi:Fe/S biogenesis protein NfuA|nr:NifU family protein [Acidimicrobiales bacterium]